MSIFVPVTTFSGEFIPSALQAPSLLGDTFCPSTFLWKFPKPTAEVPCGILLPPASNPLPEIRNDHFLEACRTQPENQLQVLKSPFKSNMVIPGDPLWNLASPQFLGALMLMFRWLVRLSSENKLSGRGSSWRMFRKLICFILMRAKKKNCKNLLFILSLLLKALQGLLPSELAVEGFAGTPYPSNWEGVPTEPTTVGSK